MHGGIEGYGDTFPTNESSVLCCILIHKKQYRRELQTVLLLVSQCRIDNRDGMKFSISYAFSNKVKRLGDAMPLCDGTRKRMRGDVRVYVLLFKYASTSKNYNLPNTEVQTENT